MSATLHKNYKSLNRFKKPNPFKPSNKKSGSAIAAKPDFFNPNYLIYFFDRYKVSVPSSVAPCKINLPEPKF